MSTLLAGAIDMSKSWNEAIQTIAFPVSYEEQGCYIYDASRKMVADVRGWGWIQNFENPEQIQNGIGGYIAEAMNEKYDRLKALEP